jgi:uncharacterized phage protein (TIGR01671 family)
MRTIKFRAWDKMKKIMSEVVEITWDTGEGDGIATEHYIGSWNRFELMQYTGLKDKNGKEIYEGDIVRGKSSPSSGRRKSKVFWTDNGWQVNMQSENRSLSFLKDRLEIIGNIYENKELLKGGE